MKIDPSGVTLVGHGIKMNSGGSGLWLWLGRSTALITGTVEVMAPPQLPKIPPLEKPVCIPCLLRAMAQGDALIQGE